MSNVLQYTLSLQDQMSANLNKIGITSTSALDKFVKLESQSKKTSQLLKDMGGSVGSLREKLNLLKNEKEWIPASNLQGIRKYNSEIKNLEKEILKLDTINGSTFKKNLGGAISNLPFADLITNPVAQAAAGLFQAGKMSMSFDEGMAKINTTAGLTSSELSGLKTQLIAMGRDAGADLATIPDAYEKIISLTGDADLSTEILNVSLKGAKAGFTDVETVAKATASIISIVGKETATAKEVMDSMFAAKRVGGAEFKDIAQYMPGLISGGKALGLTYKDVAGTFGFMTTKSANAAEAATLTQNAYTALGKKKITDKLQASGVQIFNKDKSMRDFGLIFSDLEKKIGKMKAGDKIDYLNKIGLDDVDAKKAFMALSSGNVELQKDLLATKNAQGELSKAFELAQNPMMLFSKMWSDIQTIAISVGDILGIVLAPILFGLSLTLSIVTDAILGFTNGLKTGNPFIIGFAVVVGALTLAHIYNTMILNKNIIANTRKIIVDKLSAFWSGIVAAKTTLAAVATALFTSTLFLVPLAILAIIAVIAYLAYAFDGWGKAWEHTVNGAKLLWSAFVENMHVKFLKSVNTIKNGLDFIKKGFYEFQNLIGIGNESKNNAAIAKINQDAKARQKAIADGEAKAKGLTKSGVQELINATGSIKSNGKGFGSMVGDIKKKLGIEGIAEPTQPGIDPTIDKKDDKANANKTNQAIATGGTKHNYYNITIKELNGLKDVIISSKDAAVSAGDQVGDQLLRVLAMATTATG